MMFIAPVNAEAATGSRRCSAERAMDTQKHVAREQNVGVSPLTAYWAGPPHLTVRESISPP
jgi:hypothetical protein